MNDNLLIITNYIASWSWHIIAVMFLLNAIYYLRIRAIPYFVGFIIVMALCEFMAYSRKEEVFKND